MPRDAGTGIYKYPDGTPGNPGQTIFSTRYNTFIDDLSLTLNQPLPINMGGTGGANEIEARDKLNVEVSGTQVTDFNTHVWEWGSWWSAPSATGGPIAGHGMVGIVYGYDPSYLTIQADDIQVAPNVRYVRRKVAGSWEPWTSGIVLGGDVVIDKATPIITLDKHSAAENIGIISKLNHSTRWTMSMGIGAETGGSVGSDFALYRHDDGGVAVLSPALYITRLTGDFALDGATIISGALSVRNKAPTNAQGIINFGTLGSRTLFYDGTDFHFAGGNLFLDGGKSLNCLNITATGTLNVTGLSNFATHVTVGGNVAAKSIIAVDALNSGDNPTFSMRNASATIAGRLYWDQAADEIKLTHYAGTTIRVGNTGGTGNWIASSTDTAYKPSGGPWAVGSDARIKTVTGDYSQGLEQVLALHPVTYQYKGNDVLGAKDGASLHANVTDKEFIGLVAQECETVMPEMVTRTAGYIDGAPVSDLRTLDTGPLVYALVNAIKALTARIEVLEAK